MNASPAAEASMLQRFASDLSRLLTGNLSTTDDDVYTSPENAMLHVAAAQCKAILIAAASEKIETNSGGSRGWCSDHKFTMADLEAALGGLTTFLESGRHLLENMRLKDRWHDSWHRGANDNDNANDSGEEAES